MAMVITYVHDAVLDCRMRGIYSLLAKQQYKTAAHVINDTINLVRGPTPHLASPVATSVFNHLCKALLDIAFKRYHNAHDEIRKVHYMLDQPADDGVDMYCDEM